MYLEATDRNKQQNDENKTELKKDKRLGRECKERGKAGELTLTSSKEF